MALLLRISVLAPMATLLCLAAAVPAQATHYQDMIQVSAYAPSRVYDDVSTLPVEEFERTRPPTRKRIGSHTHRIFWNNTVIGGYSVKLALSSIRRAPQRTAAIFADRPLTASQRKRLRAVAPLYDEADVMVLAAGHPACRGLTRQQARAIVAGRVTRWSQVVPGAATDAISLRYRKVGGSADLRFGARYVRLSSGRYKPSYPSNSRGSSDGGLQAATGGDQSVAAVLAWSRFVPRPGLCAVPLGGVEPSDDAVRSHRYPESWRVTYVVPRTRYRFGLDRWASQLVQAFMRSDAAKRHLARRGLLVVGYTGPDAGSPGGGSSESAPATDHAGRPITTSPTADGEQRLIGSVLEEPPSPDGWRRFLFGANGALVRHDLDGSGACVNNTSGGWAVKGAWRYSEHGGGLIARLGWFIGDPVAERTIDLPDAEPDVGYVDGVAYARRSDAPACAGS